MLPILLVVGGLVFLGFSSGNMMLGGSVLGIGIMVVIIAAAFTSAADIVFKALLYNYATGRSLPEGVNTSDFEAAFGAK